MTQGELLQEHTRVRVTAARIFVEVRTNQEDGEAMATRWSLSAALPTRSTPTQVERARMLAVADYRYFRTCDECGERHPAGLMRSGEDGADVCLNCRE